MRVHCLVIWTGLAYSTCAANGGDVVATYDASGGELPTAAGWVEVSDGSSFSLNDGVLTNSSLPLQGDCVDLPRRRMFWQHVDGDLDLTAGFSIEVEFRVIDSENTPCLCGNADRSGFRLFVADRDGYQVTAGFDGARVWFHNDHLQPCGDVPSMAFDSTDGLHIARIDTDASGSVLSLDGEPVLTLPPGGRIIGVQSDVRVGDSTSWSNSEFDIRSMSIWQQRPCNTADLSLPYGLLDLADISAFVDAFVSQGSAADLNEDGLFDLTDIDLFVNGFSTGCP